MPLFTSKMARRPTARRWAITLLPHLRTVSRSIRTVVTTDRTCTIKGVPPGTYTVAAWHEGGATGTEKTMQVTVAANGAAKADFAFGEGATATGAPSLEMMPALEFPMLGHH